MKSSTFEFNDLSIHFTQFGEGKMPLFAFHGFGRTGQDFVLFEPYIKTHYTVYAFDLFLHGKSLFPKERIEEKPISENELYDFFNNFITHHQIEHFALMGYSLGGKIALTLLQLFSEKVKEIYLLAPDGIVLNRWYNFTSRSKLGKAIYNRVINNPKPYFKFIDFLKKIGFIREKMHRFLYENMETKEKRQLVFNIWVTFSLLKPNIPLIQRQIIQNNIQCYLFFGKHDNIIKPKIGKDFAKKLPNNATLYLIDCGHVLIRERTGKIITQINEKHK